MTHTEQTVYQPCHKHDVWVSLTPKEREEAWQFGLKMAQRAKDNNYRDNRNFVLNGVDGARVSALGQVAERAAAIALKLEYTRWINGFKGADLHHNIEVRTIGEDYYGLRVQPGEDPAKRVVGVVILKGREHEPYRLPGWYLSGDAQQHPEWLHDWRERKKPVFCVPQEELRPLNELSRIIYEEQEFAYHRDEFLGMACEDREASPTEIQMAEGYARKKVMELPA